MNFIRSEILNFEFYYFVQSHNSDVLSQKRLNVKNDTVRYLRFCVYVNSLFLATYKFCKLTISYRKYIELSKKVVFDYKFIKK